MQPQPAIFQPLETGGIFALPPAAANYRHEMSFPVLVPSLNPHKHSMYTKESHSSTGRAAPTTRRAHSWPPRALEYTIIDVTDDSMTRTRLRAITTFPVFLNTPPYLNFLRLRRAALETQPPRASQPFSKKMSQNLALIFQRLFSKARVLTVR